MSEGWLKFAITMMLGLIGHTMVLTWILSGTLSDLKNANLLNANVIASVASQVLEIKQDLGDVTTRLGEVDKRLAIQEHKQ